MAAGGRVAWREGMFLRPQHFQQQDRYLEWLVSTRLNALAPYPWGVTEIEIDENLAGQGKFGVIRCSGVMPDGTTFSLPSQHPLPDPIDLPPDTRDAVISLTLPAQQIGTLEFQETQSAAVGIRFRVDEVETADAFSNELVREGIEVGHPNLHYGVTRDQTYGRICLGLARVRELQNKRLIFDDRYIPPALDIRASHRLKGGLSDIFGRAEQRVDELALNAVDLIDAGAGAITGVQMLQTLNRWCPMLRHLDTLPTVHPDRLYEMLVGMAGELATFVQKDRRPPPFPAYDHENLQLAFEPVFELLQSMLGTLIAQQAERLPLETAGPGAYVSTIANHNLYKTGYFYLAVNASTPLDDIRARFPGLAKIGPVQKMRAIVENALPGVPLRHAPTPPPQLRPLPGYIYFELDRGVAEWQDFASAPALGLHVAGEWPGLKLELWCVKRTDR